jgi:hypothetical protein
LDNAEKGLGFRANDLSERRNNAMKETKNCVSPKGKKVLLRSSDKGVVMEDVKGAVVLICNEDGYGAYGLWCGTPGAAMRLIEHWAKEQGFSQLHEDFVVDFYNRHGDYAMSDTAPDYGSFAVG